MSMGPSTAIISPSVAPLTTAEGEVPTVVVGRVMGVYGVQGWVRVRSFMQPHALLCDYRHLCIRHRSVQPWQAMTVAHWQAQADGRRIFAHLTADDTRETAGRWVGAEFGIARDQFAPLPDGQYYWLDLMGMRVTNHHGDELGEVRELMETGANDVLVVQEQPPPTPLAASTTPTMPTTPTPPTTRLIPWLETVVLAVDVANKQLTVAWELDY